jgi:hypothetical protein
MNKWTIRIGISQPTAIEKIITMRLSHDSKVVASGQAKHPLPESVALTLHPDGQVRPEQWANCLRLLTGVSSNESSFQVVDAVTKEVIFEQ